MPYSILVLVVALVSLVLAVVSNTFANPSYLMLVAIWLTLYLPGKWPW